MPFMGVRISWLIFDRKRAFKAAAFLASSTWYISSCSHFLVSLMLRIRQSTWVSTPFSSLFFSTKRSLCQSPSFIRYSRTNVSSFFMRSGRSSDPQIWKMPPDTPPPRIVCIPFHCFPTAFPISWTSDARYPGYWSLRNNLPEYRSVKYTGKFWRWRKYLVTQLHFLQCSCNCFWIAFSLYRMLSIFRQ